MKVLLKESQRRLDVVQESIAGMVKEALGLEIQGIEQALQFDVKEHVQQQLKSTHDLQVNLDQRLKTLHSESSETHERIMQITDFHGNFKEAHEDLQMQLKVVQHELNACRTQSSSKRQDTSDVWERLEEQFKNWQIDGEATSRNLKQGLADVQTDLKDLQHRLQEQLGVAQTDFKQVQKLNEQQLREIELDLQGLVECKEVSRGLQEQVGALHADSKEAQQKAKEAHLIATVALEKIHAVQCMEEKASVEGRLPVTTARTVHDPLKHTADPSQVDVSETGSPSNMMSRSGSAHGLCAVVVPDNIKVKDSGNSEHQTSANPQSSSSMPPGPGKPKATRFFDASNSVEPQKSNNATDGHALRHTTDDSLVPEDSVLKADLESKDSSSPTQKNRKFVDLLKARFSGKKSSQGDRSRSRSSPT
eukprot:gnl/MRDRNA2_/MRDRNA2_70686_c0_seq1.p1 gnl/MRDRNA2_/MRDRNA2_70686_c0~~gnl/MRDRNA2_/MRDRNA2_70686_c0_seq1.p1  ORF type:complete len:420 (-),score=113.70 gnl/MRDRNA2_/MRDRNA2_70686_c0_seq1:3-1262(-)